MYFKMLGTRPDCIVHYLLKFENKYVNYDFLFFNIEEISNLA